MATNFFKLQDDARRKTFWLILQFALMVILLILATYVLCVWGLHLVQQQQQGFEGPVNWIQPELFAAVASIMGAVVAGGSMIRFAQLASGGKAIAQMMGGKEVETNTREITERRLLNIVEEMALASGMPVPTVYLMTEEKGINAFAAGRGQGDAVVAVSQGAIDYLTRDELQGVIAHEFSHILNGDMTLNLRMLALVSGIMGLAELGRLFMNVASRSQMVTTDSEGNTRDNRGLLIAIGIALLALGAIGAFLGSLLKAAASRQREFLADASAVQFTRNPEGIGGALKKIGGLQSGSEVHAARADEVSHMFLANPLSGASLINMFATHPPLEQRIRAIDPQWDGKYPEVVPVNEDGTREINPDPRRVPPIKNLPRFPGMPHIPIPIVLAGIDSDEVRPADPEYPDEPGILGQGVREPFSSRAIVYCLLLDEKPENRQEQIAILTRLVDRKDLEEVHRLLPTIDAVPEGARLEVLNRLQPALRRMSPPQYKRFRTAVDQLIGQDQKVSLFEYTLRCLVIHRLDLAYGLRREVIGNNGNVASLTPSVVVILSHLANEGNSSQSGAEKGFQVGLQNFLGQSPPASLVRKPDTTLRDFHMGLLHCVRAVPQIKRRILDACGACALVDGKVTIPESELVRAVAAVLDCPVPRDFEAHMEKLDPSILKI